MRTWAETAEQFYDSLANEGYTLAEDQAKKLNELETQSTRKKFPKMNWRLSAAAMTVTMRQKAVLPQ